MALNTLLCSPFSFAFQQLLYTPSCQEAVILPHREYIKSRAFHAAIEGLHVASCHARHQQLFATTTSGARELGISLQPLSFSGRPHAWDACHDHASSYFTAPSFTKSTSYVHQSSSYCQHCLAAATFSICSSSRQSPALSSLPFSSAASQQDASFRTSSSSSIIWGCVQAAASALRYGSGSHILHLLLLPGLRACSLRKGSSQHHQRPAHLFSSPGGVIERLCACAGTASPMPPPPNLPPRPSPGSPPPPVRTLFLDIIIDFARCITYEPCSIQMRVCSLDHGDHQSHCAFTLQLKSIMC